MMRCAIAVGLLAVMMLLPGCSGGTAPKVALKVDVAGTVTLDGKPMNEENAAISFAVPGEAPISLPIKGGKFEGKGSVGTARVEIRAFRQGEPVTMAGKPIEGSGKENYIAEQFNDKSTLTAKIAAGGSKDLKFDVEAKK